MAWEQPSLGSSGTSSLGYVPWASWQAGQQSPATERRIYITRGLARNRLSATEVVENSRKSAWHETQV